MTEKKTQKPPPVVVPVELRKLLVDFPCCPHTGSQYQVRIWKAFRLGQKIGKPKKDKK